MLFSILTGLHVASDVLLRLSPWFLTFSLAARSCPWVSINLLLVKSCASVLWATYIFTLDHWICVVWWLLSRFFKKFTALPDIRSGTSWGVPSLTSPEKAQLSAWVCTLSSTLQG